MKKSVTTISRKPRKPAEAYTHLNLAWKKLSVSFIGRFESLHDSNRFLHFRHLTVFNSLYI